MPGSPCACRSRELVPSSRGLVLTRTLVLGGVGGQLLGVQMIGEEDVLRTPCLPPSAPAESMECNRKAGFYYDELLKECIDCSTLCGQHPKQCAPSCEGKAEWGRGAGPPGLGWREGGNPPLFVLGGVCVLPFHWDREKNTRAPASAVFSIIQVQHMARHIFPSARWCFPDVSCSSASQGQGWQLPFPPC